MFRRPEGASLWCGMRYFRGYTPFRPDVRRKDAELIRVPNPRSYVTVSGKVPPQAVTSRYVGRSERFGIWLRISRTGRSVGMRRRRTEGGFVSRVLCTVTGCIPFPFAAGRCRTVGLPEADRSSGYALLGCVGDPLFGANPAVVKRDSVRKDVGCLRVPTLSVFRERRLKR